MSAQARVARLFIAVVLLLPSSVAVAEALENSTQVAANAPAKGEDHDHDHESKPGQTAEAATPAMIATGKQVFAQNCAGCHGPNAEGKVGPKLVGTPHSPAEIRRTVTGGRPPKMPPFKDKLSAQQIAAVAAFVRSLGPPAKEGHAHEPGKPGAKEGHEHGEPGEMHGMDMSRIPGGAMTREGSGTSWLPESSPMFAKHARWGNWNIMQHGNVVLMYDAQGGPRGISRAVASNWYMLMGNRPLGKGELMFRTMLSLEPATFGNNGQPQIFQTGEGLLDRQHPHDLFMEIAGQYSHPFNDKVGGYLYFAPVGEPALGPTAFMHRISALDIPTAPLIHHWTDSTHISYGVLTAGIKTNKWKLEGSWFNGHEPDGKRWAIDPLGLNSVSGRLSYAPNPNWAFQVSHGWLDNPEVNYPSEPQGDVQRTTASATYNRPLKSGNLATTFAWGRNDRNGDTSNGFLLESNYNWAERNYLFARVERVNKDELFRDPNPRADQKFLVNAFSLGYSRDIGRSKNFETSIGAMATVYAKSSALDRAYGDFPVSVQVFLRIRPKRMQMSRGASMQDMQKKDGHSGHEHSSRGTTLRRTRLAALIAKELATDTGTFR